MIPWNGANNPNVSLTISCIMRCQYAGKHPKWILHLLVINFRLGVWFISTFIYFTSLRDRVETSTDFATRVLDIHYPTGTRVLVTVNLISDLYCRAANQYVFRVFRTWNHEEIISTCVLNKILGLKYCKNVLHSNSDNDGREVSYKIFTTLQHNLRPSL